MLQRIGILLATACLATQAAAESTAPITAGLSSKKDRGMITVISEPTLADGRLVLKIAAFNSAAEPATLTAQNVKIFTAADKPVALIPLEQLIDEATAGAADRSNARAAQTHQPANYAGPGIARNVGGEPDVSNYSGASNPTAGVISRHIPQAAPTADPQLREQIGGLKASVLQELLIAPATAAGAMVVSEKLKFARREPRTVRMVVDFNGEQHEFTFAPPPAR